MKNHISLFSCCILVNGHSRSVICDVQRNNFKLIPNALYKLIYNFDSLTKDELLMYYCEENKETVSEYIDFLIESEFAFYCSKEDIKNFPPINVSVFHSPFHISNVIFSLKDNNQQKDIIEYIKSHYKIYSAIIYYAGKNEIIDSKKDWGNIFLMKNEFNYSSCGIIDQHYFSNTIEHISESKNHNTCLNRKLTIDIMGNVRNCPNTSIIGSMNDSNLSEIIENKSFKELWTIKKDDILICRDCEFRHICTDCRAFLQEPNNIYSKPLKCGYDPYTCEWEEWSTNPIKQNAINFYHLNEKK